MKLSPERIQRLGEAVSWLGNSGISAKSKGRAALDIVLILGPVVREGWVRNEWDEPIDPRPPQPPPPPGFLK